MRNRKLIYGIVGLLMLMVIGWVISQHTSPIIAPKIAEKQENRGKLDAGTTATTGGIGNSALVGTGDAFKDYPELTAAEKEQIRTDPIAALKYAQFAEIRREENGRPLDLYGQVVDQYGSPIPGVRIAGSLVLLVAPFSTATRNVTTETDGSGRFQFVGIHGWDFGVILQKNGYEAKGASNWTTNRDLGPKNPVIFNMWKLMGAEPLIHYEIHSRVPYDGRTASFDFRSGKKAEGGELRVTLERTPLILRRGIGVKLGEDRFSWHVLLEIAGGGLVEANDRYKYLAPESGYVDSLVFEQSRNDPKWQGKLAKTFYIRFSDAKYGRVWINLTMDSDNPETGIGIETWLNPSGSRNLEFDEKKVIEPDAGAR